MNDQTANVKTFRVSLSYFPPPQPLVPLFLGHLPRSLYRPARALPSRRRSSTPAKTRLGDPQTGDRLAQTLTGRSMQWVTLRTATAAAMFLAITILASAGHGQAS